MAKELEPRLQDALSKLHAKSKKEENSGSEEANSPFFFFKLNTRSPKDSVYYKDKSVFASIDKVRFFALFYAPPFAIPFLPLQSVFTFLRRVIHPIN